MSPDQVLDAFLDALRAKSAADLAALYAVDGVHELGFVHGDGRFMRGREEIRSRYSAAWATAPVTIRAVELLARHRDGDTVIAECSLELTATATGAGFTAGAILVLHVADGLITHARDYTDNLTIATALGRIPAIAS